MYIVYGIPNCDTVKKTQTWLKENQVGFEFHNYKKDGITTEKLENWLNQVSIDELINKKGSTWKALSEEEKASVVDAQSAIAVILKNESVIKRPLIEENGKVVALGFDAKKYEEIFK
ncbi:MAG: Spx/MgsR family RNA polymerase-binding regulatory protein [Spirosomataceae bacterium]